MIAGLVSILLTSVLGDDSISLVATYQKAKGKSVCMKPWCKRKSAIFTSSDDLIMKLVQNIPATSIVSLTIV